MSVSRLIFGIFWLVLGAGGLRWRVRLRADRLAHGEPAGRIPAIVLGLGVMCVLLGLLWLDLAFN